MSGSCKGFEFEIIGELREGDGAVSAQRTVVTTGQREANADNLTDETYYSQIGFYQQYRYGAPRNYSVGLSYAF